MQWGNVNVMYIKPVRANNHVQVVPIIPSILFLNNPPGALALK